MSPNMKDRIAKAQKPRNAKTAKTAQTAQTARAPVVPFKRPTGRASFPRRMTLDLDDARFDWLRRQAYDERVTASGLLRAAVSLMQDDAKLRERVVARARQDQPEP